MNESLKRALLFVAVAVTLLGLLAYGRSLTYPYIADGYYLVEVNPVVERGDPYEILTTDFWRYKATAIGHSLYRPVTVGSFAAERKLAGAPNAPLSHGVNLLLHQFTAFMLFLYIKRIGAGVKAAAMAALLFTVHPLLMQGVVNIVGRADVLATLFSLIALWAMTYAGGFRENETSPPSRHRIASWSAAVCVLLALGSKEVAVATPALILGQEWLFRFLRKPRKAGFWVDRAATLAPVGLAITLYLVPRTLAIGAFPALQYVKPMNNVLVGMTGEPHVATVLSMLWRYVKLLVVPSSLSGDYSGSAFPAESSLLALRPLGGMFVVLALVMLVLSPLRCRGARGTAISMSALLFALPYLTIGNVLVLNGTGFAERLIYFSATGFCAILAMALERVATAAFSGAGQKLRRAAAAVFTALLLVAAWHAGNQAVMWRDAEALAERSLLATPTSLRPYLSLAEIRRHFGEDDKALEHYESAIKCSPDFGPAWMHKGVLLARRGDIAQAEAALTRAVRLLPQEGEPKMWLGLVYARQAKLELARRTLTKALLDDPGLLKAGAELGHVLYRQGRYAEAVAAYRGCIRLGREDLRPNLEQAERAERAAISQTP